MSTPNDQAKSIFLNALEIAASERQAYVVAQCGEDVALRREVEDLLEHHAGLGPFLASAASPIPTTVAAPPTTEPPSTVLGPYKLIQPIGEGGMGTVFLAQQTEPVRRLVALKVIKAGMDSKQVLARFEAERQALALMDHPNIARVLDAGTTGAGRPYFVMELVKGIPITKYCDAQHLTPRERLNLFVQVCQAVQHAHQKGVIHRDLKPSNVLVASYDGVPVVKVIDFGVAKATGQQLTDRTLVTGFGAVVGTLEYMSPEQAELNQFDIDTRSDVYSLGVLLYELLTGTTPLERKRLKDAALLEVLRVIREEEPPRPSTRLSTAEQLPSIAANRGLEPKKLSGLVRGELDWIVMKALDKDRTRRYDTANGLAMDLQRYLADEPVLACPPSAGYRLRKLLRRHKAAVLVAVAISVLLVVGAVVSTTLAVWATRAEGVAREAERERKRQLVKAKLALARAGRWSRQSGQRFEGLKALTEAAELARELGMERSVLGELRDEMVACLALADVRPLKQWEGRPAGSTSGLGFDADLERYACSDNKGNIEVRQVEGDRLLAELPGHGPGSGASGILFSPDGSLLAVTYSQQVPGQPTNFQVWDWQRKKVVFQSPFTVAAVGDFSPDGRRLPLAQGDGTVVVYELDARKEVNRLKTGSRPAWQAFHPDGTRLAVGGGGTVGVWEVATGKLRYQVAAPGLTSLAWHPRGDLLAAGCGDGNVHLWDGATGRSHAVLSGHRNNGIVVAFAAGGDLLVSTAWDGSTRLWDPWTKREILRFTGGARYVSRDGRRLAGRTGQMLTVWEVNPGREYLPLPYRPGTDGRVGKQAISPDGRWLVAVGDRCSVWDLALRKEVACLLDQLMIDVKFNPNGQEFFIYGRDGLHRWSLEARAGGVRIRPTSRLLPPGDCGPMSLDREGGRLAVARNGTCTIVDTKNPPGPVPPLPHVNATMAALSPDGRLVAAGSHSGFGIKIWDTRTGKAEKELIWNESDAAAVFSPDGRWLLSATDSEFRIWEPGTWRLVLQIPRKRVGNCEAGAAFAPDGKVLAVADSPTTIRLFDTQTWLPLARLQGHDADLINEVVFTPDGARLLVDSEGKGGVIRVWDLRRIREQLAEADLDWDLPAYPPARDGSSQPLCVKVVLDDAEIRRFLGHTQPVDAVAFSPDGLTALSASEDKTLRLWDVQTGKEIRRFDGHTKRVHDLAFSADGRRALSISHDRTMRLWDIQSGEELRRFEGHTGDGWGVAFSPDGRYALSSGADSTVRLWDLSSGKEVRRLQGHTAGVIRVCFSADGRYALSSSEDRTLRLWEVASGREVRRFVGHTAVVHGAALSPDGRRVLSSSHDRTVRLWDTDTGKELHRFEGHEGPIRGLAFSPDGRRALSGGEDRTMRLWDLDSGRLLRQFIGHTREVHGVAFSPDGRLALSAGHDNTLRLWKLPPDENAAPPEKKTDAK